ncbi:MAG: HEAT repeat domain-containing protein [Anaerolineae bacterium]|nr:HEAT repeat domain-containing protein [Anaerolineae bacterium]
MESANLIEVSNEELRFYHQLMQEYFAALTLKEICAARGAIPDEIIEPPNEWHIDLRLFDTAVEMGMEYFKNMFPYESKWKQVVIALCGIVDDVDPIIQQIAENNLFLVVDCAISGVEISEQTKSKIVSSLKRVVSDADDWAWGERLWFADELRRFGFKPESVEDKVEYYAGLMDWESVQELGEDAIPTLLKIAKQWGDESYYSEGIHGCLQELGVHLYDLLQYLLENNKDPAFDLVDKLQEDALPDLIAGLEHWNSDVREISAELVAYLAETVGYLSPSRWDVIPKLIECLQDPSWFVAKAAANALWRIGTPDSIKAAEQFWRDQQV